LPCRYYLFLDNSDTLCQYKSMKHILLKSLGKKPRKGEVFTCPICGEDFYRSPSQVSYRNLKNRYCSKACFSKSILKGADLICQNCGKQYHRAPSQIRLRGSKFCSHKCKGEDKAKNQKGENNPMWNGGVSSKNHRLRAGKKWKVWREKVFKRDDWTCQDCGNRSKADNHVVLHPHHLKSFADYPKLRFVIKNGITLCEKCHKRRHSLCGEK